MFLQIGSARVADGHGSIALEEEHGDRNTDNVTTTNDNSILSGDFDVVAVQEFDATLRSARDKHRDTTLHSKLANVQGVETINILFNGDGIQDSFFVNMLRKRQLDQNAVNIGISVQISNNL